MADAAADDALLPDLNPLLTHGAPPRFDQIRVEHVVPAIRALVAGQDAAREALERAVPSDGVRLVQALTDVAEPLGYAWNVVHHLMSVRNTPELREAQQAVEAEVVGAQLRLGQSRPIYEALRRVRDGAAWETLAPEIRRVVESGIRDAELSGVGLEGEARARFERIEMELAETSTRFANNVIDATRSFGLLLTRPDEVAGLPPTVLASAAQAARAAAAGGGDARGAAATAETGPWRITLEAPVFVPFMEHSPRRDLREQLYRAHVTRASSGPLDNQPLIETILRLRAEQAQLLGFATFAELSLTRKMARTPGAAAQLIAELRAASRPHAERELAELAAFAAAEGGPGPGPGGPALALWDVPFWAERLRERRYAYAEEDLRPYFSLPAVLDGLFALLGRLFGVTVAPADGEVPVWHPDVRYFRVRDEQGIPIASFYLDPYSRPAEKRGGAWVGACLDRKRRGPELRLPVAYVVCNQTPPVDGRPSLMTFREVETLFHEVGHALQHMLTRVDEPAAAGLNNIEWDAVELPSQFMENWCFHRGTLAGLARHVDTGAPLPSELFDKIAAARTYRAGSQFLRQIYFATLDLELHHRFDPRTAELSAVVGRVAADNTVLPPLPEDRFLCSFTHIFAGGYAAGYYSYKWAEVLAADAFAAFEEAGLDDPGALVQIGRRFRDTILALGGSRHPTEVFQAFRGRGPIIEPLLRRSGLASAG